MADYLLEARKITKVFPGVVALKEVDFNLREGEVHALIGENGAGKSTLMKIFAGAIAPENGEIFLNNKKIVINNPIISQKYGFSIIFQELNYFPDLSVEENIFFGIEPLNRVRMINKKIIGNESKAILKYVGLNINPKIIMRDLSVSQKQMVEIAKALVRNAKIIIMDEPTSSLSSKEIDHLFEIISSLKEQKKSVILITHKLEEIFNFGLVDRVSVLRDGELIGSYHTSEIDNESLINKMVGRTISNLFPKEKLPIGDEILRVEDLTKKGYFENISFSLHEGEILGLSGLVGAKRTEVVSALYGLFKVDKGSIYLKGKKVRIGNPFEAVKLGIVMIPEERHLTGLFIKLNLIMNITAAILKKISRFSFIDIKKEIEVARKMYAQLNIKGGGIYSIAESFSGGNQQKIVLSKNLAVVPKVIIMDEPTKGIDVGSKSEFHRIMVQLAKQGTGIIMVSSEMPEILGMSDRIIVMCNGKKTAELSIQEATQPKIMKAAIGMV
jgi:rhamnose transport system ATP-binding protein